jgi:hypothetical protein
MLHIPSRWSSFLGRMLKKCFRILIMSPRRAEDNPAMNRERDLLPWILGGLSTAAVALAIAAVSTQHAAPPAAQPTAIVAATSPAPALPGTAPDMPSAPAVVATVTAANSSVTTPPQGEAPTEVRPGQIWTCTTKGVKTFSNNPCGENSSLLDVGPINTMNPSAPLHYARAYPAPAQYATPYRDAGAQSYAEDDSDQDGYDSGADSYTVVQGIAVPPRRHFEHHPHRPPYHQHSASAPRKF